MNISEGLSTPFHKYDHEGDGETVHALAEVLERIMA